MAEVEAPEIPQEEKAHIDTVTSEVGPEADKEEAPKEGANGIKKENVPPKRPGVTAAKKPAATSASIGTKPAASSATRTTGGLSKPPTRPAAGSVVRKPASSAIPATSSSSAHKAKESIGGSGDEKKKPLSSTPKRTSLTSSVTQNSPTKATTTAEKRTSAVPATSAVRKSATVSTSSPKPTVKPATSSSTTTTRATAPASTTAAGRTSHASKPSIGGGADTKKRLSTTSGPPGLATKTPTRPTGTSAPPSSSKEVEELKAKLQDSETRVEELKAEIASSQEKLLELGQQVHVEAQRVTETEENIRSQHHEIIDKYSAEIDELKAQLAEAEVAQKAAQESSLKAIEEAQKSATAKDLEVVEIIEKHKAEHASALEAISLDLAAAKEANATATTYAAVTEAEITDIKCQLEKANVEVVSLNDSLKALQAEQETKSKDLNAKLTSQGEEHQAALVVLTKDLADKAELHESIKADLEKRLEEAQVAQTAFEAFHKQKSQIEQAELTAKIAGLEAELSGLKAGAERDSQSLQELKGFKVKFEAAQKELLSAQEELSVVTKKLGVVEAKGSEDAKATLKARDDLAAAAEQITSLKMILEQLDEDGRSKDDLHSKTKAELAATLKSLEVRTNEISLLEEKHKKEVLKHQKELETVSNDYEKEIEALQGNSGIKDQYEELKAKHEELVKVHSETAASHADELEQLKQDLAVAIAALDTKETDHQKALEELKTTYAKNLDETHDRAITAGHAAHAAELEQMQSNHASAIASLKEQYESSLATLSSDLETHKVAKIALQAERAKTQEALLKAQADLGAFKEDLAHEKFARASAEADLDAANSKKPDTSEADSLRKELLALKDQFKATHITSQQEIAKVTEEHLATKASLDKAIKDLEEQKAEADAKTKSSETDLVDMHDSMTQLVEEANKTAEGEKKKVGDLEARLQEAEAKLKVKDAELAEAQAKSSSLPSPNTPGSAGKPSSGLRASKFAEDLGSDSATAPDTEKEAEEAEGEHDSSSAALALLAKASVTAQQLGEINKDLKEDNLRMLKSITDISLPSVST